MADSNPLLPPRNDDADGRFEYTHHHHEKKLSVDERIEQYIGEFGWPQLIQSVLVSLAWTFDAQQTFISVFTDAEPGWHCVGSQCGSYSDVCDLPSDATWAWNSPKESTIISEWGLQCASSFVKGLPASSFFFGCLIGGIVLATLADSWLGRKNLLLFSCFSMSISGILTAFVSTNVWVYALLRFVCGFGRAAIGTCSLVLATEVVGKRWRGQMISPPQLLDIVRNCSWSLFLKFILLSGLMICCLRN